MKIVQMVFFTLVLFMFCIFNVLAKDPPQPAAAGERTSTTPPPPPGLPVDENINTMMALALLFGIYIIYSFKLKQKTLM
ncbi:hypothetical protein EKL98_00660 [Flavobacterium bomense]|uniref:Signal peptidase n=1 Tax=Flavobacterium bomense TaxID=2497483 RepID=A0A3S0P2N1_9FLAO|nr:MULTISPECIES: hypothetical protein [Flavobacterium]RTZ04778.1 hypothetical protein EKM03_10660 [Flavobacterium sp. GSP6]RTZ07861.1 hypothetical protein EKL98_00660 [Flavobacterium bomense]